MDFLKRITSFFILMCFVGMLALPVSAAPFSEAETTGSIQVRLVYEGSPVSGGTLTLYRVGEIADGAAEFALCDAFRESGADLAMPNDPNTAQVLAQYARENKIPGKIRKLDEQGTAYFTQLQTGLYLIVQGESSPGYEAIRPFLVGIPQVVGESVCCDIDASPKVALIPQPPAETHPADSTGPRLPQTGQLNWPVPVMTAAGVMLVGMGGFLRFGKRKNNEK